MLTEKQLNEVRYYLENIHGMIGSALMYIQEGKQGEPVGYLADALISARSALNITGLMPRPEQASQEAAPAAPTDTPRQEPASVEQGLYEGHPEDENVAQP